MRNTLRVVTLVLCLIFTSGCTQVAPVLVSGLQDLLPIATSEEVNNAGHTTTNSEQYGLDGTCAADDIECTLAEGTIVQLTAVCEIPDSDDDCIGTFTYEDWFLEPQSLVTAHHEGDGEFVVTLFRDNGTTEVLFEATGNYTSDTITLAPTGIVSMTVQSTGPWYVDVKRVE